MKAVEIFMIRKSFGRNSSEKIRQEAEALVNEKHYQGYRVINIDFAIIFSSVATRIRVRLWFSPI